MDAEARQGEVLTRVRARGRTSAGELAASLGVSVETVRRDLAALAARGVVRRVHGGAVPVETAGFESDIERRSRTDVAEKQRIARAAAELVRDAESVFVDEGFTPYLVARELADLGPRTVVTASIPAAQALAPAPQVSVLVLGGRMRGRTLATVDHWALRMLDGLVLDVAVVGANGISLERGLTTPDASVAAVKERALQAARRGVFVGTHAKFGVSSLCRFAAVGELEAVVTDTGLPRSVAGRFETAGPRVLRV